ncbi:MAG: CHRD domain-containing protein [Vicinamibacterales bacterium]
MRRMMMYVAAAAVVGLGATTDASAQTYRLTAVLSGANETPAAIVTGATGTAEVFVNVATETVTYRVEVFNLPSGAVGGHFHVGGPGVGGPVVIDLAPPANVSNDFVLAGTVNPSALRARPDQGIRTFEDFIQSLVAGQVYVNIHSAVNPGGETRGQLTVSQ